MTYISAFKGRWCGHCNGRGSTPRALRASKYFEPSGHWEDECPKCHWTGFVGLTSEQVREVEILSLPPRTLGRDESQEELPYPLEAS